jgi:hypothetical protein
LIFIYLFIYFVRFFIADICRSQNADQSNILHHVIMARSFVRSRRPNPMHPFHHPHHGMQYWEQVKEPVGPAPRSGHVPHAGGHGRHISSGHRAGFVSGFFFFFNFYSPDFLFPLCLLLVHLAHKLTA